MGWLISCTCTFVGNYHFESDRKPQVATCNFTTVTIFYCHLLPDMEELLPHMLANSSCKYSLAQKKRLETHSCPHVQMFLQQNMQSQEPTYQIIWSRMSRIWYPFFIRAIMSSRAVHRRHLSAKRSAVLKSCCEAIDKVLLCEILRGWAKTLGHTSFHAR